MMNAATDNDDLASADADWEHLKDTKRVETIAELLKKLRNVKKKRMSKFILKDILGSDGANKTRGKNARHLKALRREGLKVNKIYCTVTHFKKKTAIRCARLLKNTKDSKKETYP